MRKHGKRDGLKLEGPQNLETPVKRASFILFSSLQVEDFAGYLYNQQAFLSPPSSPWPSGRIEGVAHHGRLGCVGMGVCGLLA